MIDKEAVISAVKRELQALYGERLAQVILYGSYARGDFNEDSDIDFLVVLKDEEIRTITEVMRISGAMFPLDLKYGAMISAQPTTLQLLKESDVLFYKNIRREGIAV